MDLIRTSIERPIAVIAAVLMVLMFGWVALRSIPIQLTPDINRPIIVISTSWPGAAPAEVEREIVTRQEEALKGLEGLEEVSSSSSAGRGSVTLTFAIDANMDRALLLTANRLDRVNGYPEEADEPTIETADSNDNAIAWLSLTHAPGNERPIHTYGTFIEDVVKERLERVSGVASVGAFGGTEQEMQVVVDPVRLARYGMTVPELVGALRAANVSISAGDVEEGKRRYIVRTDSDFTSLDQVGEVLVRSRTDTAGGTVGRVTVADVAEVRFDYKEPSARIRYLGRPALAISMQRETGANVIEVMTGVRAAVAELNAGPIPGQGLQLNQIYDETEYISSAIDLVQSNILVGGLLAVAMLLLFLRSLRATIVIGVAIPVSVIGSFVAMAALGRSINVISLAGIAFAVGMVVDAAIVVLENIFRLRQQGRPADKAAHEGAQQVWGAVLVSALTTVMVFIPILVMKLEVGQLFRDIAVAISVSVLLSLLVAVTVIPALSSKLLAGRTGRQGGMLGLPGIDHLARGFLAGVLGFTRTIVRSKVLALGVVLAVSAVAIATTWTFRPDLEYLPNGNRNFVRGRIIPPAGYNLATSTVIAENTEAAVRPLWASETGPESVPGQPPKIRHFFFVSLRNFAFIGGSAIDGRRAAELIPVLRRPVFREPGVLGFMTQASLFGRGLGGARTIELDISGGDLETILAVAADAAQLTARALPFAEGNQFRPLPGLELGAPEVRILPDPTRLADNGVTATQLGVTVDAFNDGIRIAEITVDGKRIDLTLRGPQALIGETQGIGAIPVVTADGAIVPVSSLADVLVTAGPTEIRRRERARTVTLNIIPAESLPLETAIEIVASQVIRPLTERGLPTGVSLSLSGTADQLERTWNAMVLDLLLALVIVYLVMAILFESFAYPLIIMISVPVATAGGIGGLVVLNQFVPQQLDMLTLLGFVILIGIVVNNAILLVHQSLFHYRSDRMAIDEAIVEATKNRVRPIFMSTLTSVFGMLPLVLFPGAGSELYRGLGSVVLGGLSLSAVLTLLIVPPLMTVFMGTIEGARQVLTPAAMAPARAGRAAREKPTPANAAE